MKPPNFRATIERAEMAAVVQNSNREQVCRGSESTMKPSSGKQSNIVEFYRNRSIFITGGSGFIGKVLIEKLLRTCPEVRHIFVLIRPKWQKQPSERLAELLKAPLFDQVREKADLLEKVIVVEGDVTKSNLGLSDQNLLKIMNEVSVIYHSAATVKFDEPLKQSIAINIAGTKNMIDVCRKIPQLASLVHVSTAYANCDKTEIDEHIYPVSDSFIDEHSTLGNDDPEKLIELANWLDQETLQELKSKLLNQRPNTYTYTKALAEWLLIKSARDLPVVICRPSIVVASWREPFEGWIDNVNGPTGIILGAGKGLIRSMYAESSCVADLIPVDTVINLIITLGWFANAYHRTLKRSIGDVAESLTESLSSIDRLSISDATIDSVSADLSSDDTANLASNGNNGNNNDNYNGNKGISNNNNNNNSSRAESFLTFDSLVTRHNGNNNNNHHQDPNEPSRMDPTMDDGYGSFRSCSPSSISASPTKSLSDKTLPSDVICSSNQLCRSNLNKRRDSEAIIEKRISNEQKQAAFEYKLKQFRHSNHQRLSAKNLPEHLADIPVFHCTSGQMNPITWGRIQVLIISICALYPSIATYRYPSGSFTNNKLLDDFYRLTLHYMPGYIVDFFTKLFGGKPILVKIFKKFDQAANVLKAFTSKQWRFNNDNGQMLINELMSEEDKLLFSCDVSSLDWTNFLHGYVLGVRQFMLKEPIENLAEARRNLTFVYYRNLSLQAIFFISFLYLTSFIYTL